MNSKQVNETVNKVFSFMQNVKDGELQTILVNMQKMNDYMAEKLRIYEEHLASLTGKKRPILTESDARRLVSIYRNAAVCNRIDGFRPSGTFDSIRTGS